MNIQVDCRLYKKKKKKKIVFWLLYIIFVLTCLGIDEFLGHGYIIFYIVFKCLDTRVIQMANKELVIVVLKSYF